MDEYSPKRHDIAQLRFLCEKLYDDAMSSLIDSHNGWVSDPVSDSQLQLNDLIEHIAYFTMNYKIKHAEDDALIKKIDEYLDDTFMLFTNYSINPQDLNRWQHDTQRLLNLFSEECAQLQQLSHSI